MVFLYGTDGFRLRQAKLNLIEEYRKKYPSGVNLFYFNLSEEANLNKIRDALKNVSFFDEHKLIVISEAFNKKNIAGELKEVLKNAGPDATFLFVEEGAEKELNTKNKELFKVLIEAKVVKSFEPLSGPKLAQWAKSEIEIRECSISENNLKDLLNLTGNDSWAVINEIDKLTAYRKSGEIMLTDIKSLIPEKVENNAFAFVDMLGAGNTKGALALLYRELENNGDPYQILGAVIYQFRNMLVVKDMLSKGESLPEISKKAGLHPFVVKKTSNQVEKFSLDKLKKLYGDILALDISAKNGNISLELGLNKFILSV